MQQSISIAILPRDRDNPAKWAEIAASELGIATDRITGCQLERRSIDARARQIKFILKLRVYVDEPPAPTAPIVRTYHDVSSRPPVIVIGAGPAGLFAALRLIELGLRPIVVERGKDVRARRRDLAAITRQGVVNPDSNYCFGEGGAGTYSDGKLYTRSDKRGNIRQVLETLVHFGAAESILIDAHPHIGTNKLPAIIAAMREAILSAGGAIHFECRATDVVLADSKIAGVRVASGDEYNAGAVVLATGHSARDIFELLHHRNVPIEFKPFALGVRVEHPQPLIDEMQYRCDTRPDILPPAAYSLVAQVDGKGVYSFCMCPGGIIAPCATSNEEIVTNGWSPSKRNNPFANSGIVVSIDEEDIKPFAASGPLAGLRFQQNVERVAWKSGPGGQSAPAQRLVDFLAHKQSTDLPANSYRPAVHAANLFEVLPKAVAKRLEGGFREFGRKNPKFLSGDAILVAPESRTSSPVRIPRDKVTLEHPTIAGLYPCGEGAGYSGGIVSAAMDGERVASAIAEKMLHR